MLHRAKQAARERQGTIEFEYRARYGLTVNDPRYLDATVEEMLIDNLAHRYREDPKLMDEIEDEDFDADDVAAAIGRQEPPPDDWEELS